MAEKLYTTKTASLKATNADIRKIEATKLMVSPDGKSSSEKQDVVELIKKSGLTYGGEINGTRNLVADADKDGVIDSGTGFGKVSGINFRGSNVMLVPKSDGTLDLWFGPNNNPGTASTLSGGNGSSKYVFASSTNAYDISGITAGNTYGLCDLTSSTETFNVNSGNEITITDDKPTIKATVTTGGGKTYTCETAAIDNSTYDSQNSSTGADLYRTNVTASTTVNTIADGIKITVYNIHVNNDGIDANGGKTPGFTRCKIKIEVKNGAILPDGGTYTVTCQAGSAATSASSKMFVYKTASSNPSIKEVTATYTKTGTIQISGVTYDKGANVALTVTEVSGTQQMITTDANRLTISDTSGNVTNFTSPVSTSTTGMTSTGTTTNETAVYSYSQTVGCSATTPTKVSGSVTVTPHGQAGAVSAAAVTKNIDVTGQGYLYTSHTTNDTNGAGLSVVCNFCNEAQRKYATLSDVTGTATINDYDSSKSLVGDYTSQLLVQAGSLKYPKANSYNDIISYSGATGTRYYVVPLAFKHTAASPINSLTVSVGSGMASDYNTANVRLYVAKKGNSTVQVLNAYKMNACAYGTAIGNATKPSSGSWTCEVNYNGLGFPMATVNGVTTDYYLIVEMPQPASGNGASIGKITVTANV